MPKRAGRCAALAGLALLAACSQQLARNRQYLLRSSQQPPTAPATDHARGAASASPTIRELHPPLPISPRGGVTLAALGEPLAIKLSWAALRPAASERFFVEVLAREAHGNRTIFSAYVRRLDMTLMLPAISGRYVWRVFGVAGAHAHYVPSAWSEFGVDAGAAP